MNDFHIKNFDKNKIIKDYLFLVHILTQYKEDQVIRIKIDIIGGGPAGLSTAISLKEHDKSIKVVLHEQHKNIGYNANARRCGEAYTIFKDFRRREPGRNSIFNVIKKQEFIIGNKKYIMPLPPNVFSTFILNRQKFIAELGKQAKKLGVQIYTEYKIKSVNDLDGDYIVDASGCPSIVKRELKLNKGIKGIGYQQTIENSNYFNNDTIKLVFSDVIGYYWIFPRDPTKKEINVGVGVIGKGEGNLRNILEEFKKQWGIEGKINYKTGGLIPVGLQKPLIYRNILFVGDTGIGTFPLNGEGIYLAILSSEIAGKCLAQNYPEKYPYLINQVLIKWDVIGKTFIRTGNILKKIGVKAYLKSLKYFFEIIYFPILY
jgi:flavin-dependent dehydrogenase